MFFVAPSENYKQMEASMSSMKMIQNKANDLSFFAEWVYTSKSENNIHGFTYSILIVFS